LQVRPGFQLRVVRLSEPPAPARRAIDEVTKLHAERPLLTPNFALARVRTGNAFKPELTRP
jgi:hypothetical protein